MKTAPSNQCHSHLGAAQRLSPQLPLPPRPILHDQAQPSRGPKKRAQIHSAIAVLTQLELLKKFSKGLTLDGAVTLTIDACLAEAEKLPTDSELYQHGFGCAFAPSGNLRR